MRCILKIKAKAAVMLAIMLVVASIVPMTSDVYAEVQTFNDGFAESSTLNDLKSKGWSFDDDSVMSFEDDVLTAKVKSTDNLNKKYQFSYDLGSELSGEFYVEVDFSLGGTSAYGNQDFVFLANGETTSSDAFGKIYGIGATMFAANMDSYNCICGNGGTAKHATTNLTIYYTPTSDFTTSVYSATSANNYIRLRNDKLTVRYYINTDEGYFTTQLKKFGATSWTNSVQHAHKTTGANHLIQMPIRKKADGSNRGFSTLVFQTPFKRPFAEQAWVESKDTDAYIQIHGVRVEKFQTATASAKLSTGDTIVNDSIIAKPDKVDLTFTAPITSGHESIELYENNIKVAVPACEWNADKTVLTYAGSNFKNSSAYKIVVPGSKMSSNEYPVEDAEIKFLTEHEVLPITKNSVTITDETQTPIAENALTGLTGGAGKAISVKVNATNTGAEKQKLTLIVALYSDNSGFIVTEKVSCDVVEIETGQAKDLTAQINLPETGTFTARIYLWDSLSGMIPLNTYTAPQI